MKPIIIYTTQNCPYCVRAKTLLENKGADFDEIRIDLEPQRRQEMLSKSNGRQTVPQIFIGDTHVGGFDDLWELEKQGELNQLLEI